MPSHTWAPPRRHRARARRHTTARSPSVHPPPAPAATWSESYVLPPRRQVVYDERGDNPVQPRRCRVPAACYGSLRRRGLRFRHHQPGWLVAERGLVLLAGEAKPGGRRQALEGLGRCSWSWGRGCPRNSLSWGPGSPWGAGPSRDFYSISSWAILTRVCGLGGYQGVCSPPGGLGEAEGSHGPSPAT